MGSGMVLRLRDSSGGVVVSVCVLLLCVSVLLVFVFVFVLLLLFVCVLFVYDCAGGICWDKFNDSVGLFLFLFFSLFLLL